MTSRTWTGDDDRDELTADPDQPQCPDCGAYATEPCDPLCGCVACRKRDLATLDVLPEGEVA